MKLPVKADLEEGDYNDLVVPAPHLSTDTIINIQKILRDIIADDAINSVSIAMVGGPGTVIEIDKSMFGKFSMNSPSGQIQSLSSYRSSLNP